MIGIVLLLLVAVVVWMMSGRGDSKQEIGEDNDARRPTPQGGENTRGVEGARVKVGGKAYDLVPNQLGEFQRVYLEKGGSAEVTVRFPEGKPGDKVAVAILDGGTVGEVAGETGAHRAPLQGTA